MSGWWASCWTGWWRWPAASSLTALRRAEETAPMERFLEISQLSVAFPKAPVPVLREIDLTIARGEYVAVIGHSGCGKSTLLNVIAGLLPASAGGVVLEGREVEGPGPDRAVVFQNHSLLPWLTCYQNVRLA